MKRPCKCARSLLFGFLSFIQIQCESQTTEKCNDDFFKMDTAFTVAIKTESITISPQQLKMTVDTKNNRGFVFLGIAHDIREIELCEIDLATSKNKIHRFKYSKKEKIDKRDNFATVYINSEGNLKLHIADLMLYADIKSNEITKVEKINSKYRNFFFAQDHSVASYYYNDFDKYSRTGIHILENNKDIASIHPNGDFIQFTHFSPNRLVACNNDFILWLSVSKPIIYSYNHKLEKLDSLNFDTTNWVDVEEIKDEPRYADLLKKGVFEFGFKVLEDTACKNCSVQFINDSTFIVTSMYTVDTAQERIFSIDEQGKVKLIKQRSIESTSLPYGNWTIDNFELPFLTAKATIESEKMYYLETGPGHLPWESAPTSKTNFSKYTYLNIIQYQFIQP